MNNFMTFTQALKDFFNALGNEKRQEIILNIFSDKNEHNITEVAKRANIAQSTASEHLSFLKRSGILVSKKVKKEVYYKLDREGILKLIDEIKTGLTCC